MQRTSRGNQVAEKRGRAIYEIIGIASVQKPPVSEITVSHSPKKVYNVTYLSKVEILFRIHAWLALVDEFAISMMGYRFGGSNRLAFPARTGSHCKSKREG